MFVGCSSFRSAAASATKRLTAIAAVFSTRRPPRRPPAAAARPVACGSVSLTAPRLVAAEDHHEAVLADRLDEHLDAGRIVSSLSTARATQRSVLGRPARRSVIRPSASTVQKLPRAATSLRPELEVDAERLEHAAADAGTRSGS